MAAAEISRTEDTEPDRGAHPPEKRQALKESLDKHLKKSLAKGDTW